MSVSPNSKSLLGRQANSRACSNFIPLALSLAASAGFTHSASAFDASDRLVVSAGSNRSVQTTNGRTVSLRGVNVNALVDYDNGRTAVPFTVDDANQIKAMGFNVVRLAISWSKLEPSPDVWDEAYANEIRRITGLLVDRNVYVVLSMHQDRFGKGLGQSDSRVEVNGAPRWAAVTGGKSCSTGSGHSYYSTACSMQAATNFFITNSKVGGKTSHLQYLEVVRKIASIATQFGPGIAGISLYNEPKDPAITATDKFESTYLYSFYSKMIKGLRSTGWSGPIWLDPDARRTDTDNNTAARRFIEDPALVYAPHIYTDVFSQSGVTYNTIGKLSSSFDNAQREASVLGAALVPGELTGAGGGPFEEYRDHVLRHLDNRVLGGIFWVWKQSANSDYGWGVLDQSGAIRGGTEIAQDLSRPRVIDGPGIGSASYSNDSDLSFTTNGSGGTVTVWTGADYNSAGRLRGTVKVDGAYVSNSSTSSMTGFGSPTPLIGGRYLKFNVPAGTHNVVVGR